MPLGPTCLKSAKTPNNKKPPAHGGFLLLKHGLNNATHNDQLTFIPFLCGAYSMRRSPIIAIAALVAGALGLGLAKAANKSNKEENERQRREEEERDNDD